MNLFVVFGILAMVASLANGFGIGNVNKNTFIRNGKSISMTDKNGHQEVMIDGKPATKQQVKDMGKGMMNWMGNMGMGFGMDQHNKMMEQHNKMMEEHNKKMANLANGLVNWGKPGQGKVNRRKPGQDIVNTGPISIGNGMGSGVNIGGIGQTNTNTIEQHGNIDQSNWNFG